MSTGLMARTGHDSPMALLRAQSVYVAFAALIVIDLIFTPGFRNVFVIRNLLFEAAPVILVTLGQSLAIGTRGIDLSVGSTMGLAAAVMALALPGGSSGR
jgi:ribose/xylose/arabinose/galactoside ABC-type transport system permease subunit